MLQMLHHKKLTQPNESMNHSVVTMAPKNKDDSKSKYLKTRVMLTGTAQIVGHYKLWFQTFKMWIFNG